FLANVHECRSLRAAWLARSAVLGDLLPPHVTGALPHAAPVPGVERKVATRRGELLLMPRDASGRGQNLDEAALARDFQVSLRTVQRDLAALRQAGCLP